MLNRIRFKIAEYLDKRNPDACWANLVMWSLGYHSLRETFGRDGDWKIQLCKLNGDLPFCGKCGDKNGG